MKTAYQNATYKLRGSLDRTVANLLSMIKETDQDADMYGLGPVIEDFETRIKEDLGMEAACFFPSGTMAQQIALRIWSDELDHKTVLYHPLCHLEIHEQDGIKELHHLQPILLGEEDRLFTLEDLKNSNQEACTLLIELPQREIGGQLPTWDELSLIISYAKSKNMKVHLDGARLFEVLPYYQVSIKELVSLFDSVYISFYKGLSGIAGAMLLGSTKFIDQAKIWKRRHGGDLISLFPYILSSKTVYLERASKMNLYYQKAMKLAKEFNKLPLCYTIPTVPVSNMFHLYFQLPPTVLSSELANLMHDTKVGLSPYLNERKNESMFELSVGDFALAIPDEILENFFTKLEELLKKHL